jgi:uncharacterized membrane protein
MVTYRKTITIDKPIPEVFDYISDLEKVPQWQSALAEVERITKSPLGVGSLYKSERKFLGRKLEAEIELIVYELNKRIVFRSISGSTPFEQSYVFEITPQGTRLTTLLELHTTGLMVLAEPLIASSVRREMEVDFGRLKDMLESRVPEVFELME